MGRRHEKVGDVVIFNRLHAAHAFAAAVLLPEMIHRHPFDISHLRRRDHDLLVGDQVLDRIIVFVKSDRRAPVVAVFFGNRQDLRSDRLQKKVSVREDRTQPADRLLQLPVFLLDLGPLETCQGAESHIHDRLRLRIGQSESRGQLRFCDLDVFRPADDADHFIDIVKGDQQSFQDVSSLLVFFQIELRSSSYHIDLMIDIVFDDILQRQQHRSVVYQNVVVDTEGGLYRRQFV